MTYLPLYQTSTSHIKVLLSPLSENQHWNQAHMDIKGRAWTKDHVHMHMFPYQAHEVRLGSDLNPSVQSFCVGLSYTRVRIMTNTERDKEWHTERVCVFVGISVHRWETQQKGLKLRNKKVQNGHRIVSWPVWADRHPCLHRSSLIAGITIWNVQSFGSKCKPRRHNSCETRLQSLWSRQKP
jgi:hypothetical protein